MFHFKFLYIPGTEFLYNFFLLSKQIISTGLKIVIFNCNRSGPSICLSKDGKGAINGERSRGKTLMPESTQFAL